jgi:hypothetical protein
MIRRLVVLGIMIFIVGTPRICQSTESSEKFTHSVSPSFRKMAEESDKEVMHEPGQGSLTAHYAMLVDETFKTSGWQPKDGLFGIIPRVSTGDDVEKILGVPGTIYKDTSGRNVWYYQGYAVSVIFDKETNTVLSLTIKDSYKGELKVPKTLAAAEAMFGRLARTTLQPFGIRDYERPGLRVACYDTPEAIKPVHLLFVHDPTDAIKGAKLRSSQ